jgi:hypothetical protein
MAAFSTEIRASVAFSVVFEVFLDWMETAIPLRCAFQALCRRIPMPHMKLAAAILFALALAPGVAQAWTHHHPRHHHHHISHYGLPYVISYSHNYGPGALPGTFGYYDGPSTNACSQGSATYRGQDHRRYACF